MGESAEDRVGMIATLATLPEHPESVPINMLVKVEGTPLAQGGTLEFGIDRDEAVSPYGDVSEGNGADILGGETFIPSGTQDREGLTFVATLADGSTVTGTFVNRLGAGFSPVDGFGVVNAQAAVARVLPARKETSAPAARERRVLR